MKKTFVLCCVLFLFFVSCGKQEVVEAPIEEGKEEVVSMQTRKVPTTKSIFHRTELDPIEWNKSLLVTFGYDVLEEELAESVKVYKSEVDKDNEVSFAIEVVSSHEFLIHGIGEETLWEEDGTYIFWIAKDFFILEGARNADAVYDFSVTFLKPPSGPLYIKDINWKEDYALIGDKLYTDRYEIVFSYSLNPAFTKSSLTFFPEDTDANIEIGEDRIILQGNFSPKKDYQLRVEEVTDSFGRSFYFPVVELPRNEGIQTGENPKLFSLNPRNTFFYAKASAPSFLLKKGKEESVTTVTLCRINIEKETTFTETALIYANFEEGRGYSDQQRDALKEQLVFPQDISLRDCSERLVERITFEDAKVEQMVMEKWLAKMRQPYGIFALYINNEGDLNRKAQFFGVVNVGMLWKYGQKEGLAWAFDLDTTRPVVAQDIYLKEFESSGARNNRELPSNPAKIFGVYDVESQGKTDQNGILTFESPKNKTISSLGALLVSDRYFGVVSPKWNEGLNSFNFPVTTRDSGRGLDEEITNDERVLAGRHILGHAYTEKLLYRPGQTINVKALFRERSKDKLELDFPESFDTVNFKILDPENEEILASEILINEYGSTKIQYHIPENAKLGKYTMTVTPKIGDWLMDSAKVYLIVKVEEYVLPTFKTEATSEKHDYFSDETIDVKIQATEYSGPPLKKGKINYRLIARPFYLEDEEDEGFFYGQEFLRFRKSYRTETVETGEVELNVKGEAVVEISMESEEYDAEFDYSLSFEYEISDDQNRKVSDIVSFRRFRAKNQDDHVPGIRFESKIFHKEDPVEFDFVSKNFRLERMPEKEFTVKFMKKVQKCEAVLEVLKGEKKKCDIVLEVQLEEKIKTDAEGFGHFEKKMEEPGNYVVELANGEKKVTKGVWITSFGVAPSVDTKEDRYLDMVFDKEAYKPGETAKLYIHSPYEKSLLLLSFEANDVIKTEVIEMQTAALEYAIPVVNEFLPNVYVNAIVVENSESEIPDFKIGYLNLPVDISEKDLKIEIVSEKEVYKPGEKAVLEVITKDVNGNPVAAEISLAVVDEAIIRLGGQVDTRLKRTFYSRRLLFVNNAFTLVGLHNDRYFATYGGSGKGGFAYDVPPVRKNFEEVAYFNAILNTDEEGKASVEFLMPEKLTSYIILGAGFSKNARQLMGSSESMVEIRQDFYIDPILPRFFRKNDEVVLKARVYNLTEKDAEVGMLLEGEGFELLEENNEKRQTVMAKTTQDFTFRVKIAADAQEARIVFKSVSEAGNDAIEFTKEIHGYELISDLIGSAPLRNDEQSEQLIIEVPKYASAGTMEVELTSSLLAVLQQKLAKLLRYPYGCAEQTTSSTVPNAVFYAVGKELNLPENTQAQENTLAGLERLQTFQREDGGFGLWTGGDESSLHVSLTVGNGLVDIQQSGFEIPADMKEPFVEYLENRIVSEPNGGRKNSLDNFSKLDVVYILTNLNPTKDYVRYVEMLFYQLPVISNNVKSKLAQIYLLRKQQVGVDEILDLKLALIKKDIWASIEEEEGVYSVKTGTKIGSRRAFTNRRTDLVELLRVLVQLDPKDERLRQMVRFVMGEGGSSSRYISSYAERVKFLMLADFLRLSPANNQDFEIIFMIGTQDVSVTLKDFGSEKLTFDLDSVWDEEHQILIGSLLDEENDIFVNYKVSYQVENIDNMESTENGIWVERTIKDEAGKEVKDSREIKVGDIFEIKLGIENKGEARNVAVTDALPATMEFVETKSHSSGFQQLNFRDERLDAFLKDNVRKMDLLYKVRIISEGTFHWPGAESYAMYDPDINGTSYGQRIIVGQ